jgi:ketosteroid isomerase-like protein
MPENKAKSSTNTELTARAFEAFSAGDLKTLSELTSPDCVWIVGGNNKLSGTYHGRDATFDYFAQLHVATGGTFTITVLTINEVDPDTMIVTSHVNATANGVTFDEEIIQQLHLRNGQCIACRTFVENGFRFDALLGGPQTITLPDQTARSAAPV